MAAGDFVGTWQVYRFCTSNSCLTWPRRIERITLMDICESPVQVRSPWYEFLENGYGFIKSTDCYTDQLLPRDNSCLFQDITSSAKKVKVYADIVESPGARILLRGYDENLNWIQTYDGGQWIEGEWVNISSVSPAISGKLYYPPGPIEVVKLVTNGPIRLYSWENSGAQVALATYEPGETRPTYRRSLIAGLSENGEGCSQKTVTALVKLRHIDAISDNDYMVLQSREAFRLACQALRKEENNLFDDANIYWNGRWDAAERRYRNGAIPLLQDELANHMGPGVVNPIRYPPRSIAGAYIPNLI